MNMEIKLSYFLFFGILFERGEGSMFNGFDAKYDFSNLSYAVSYKGKFIGFFSGACPEHAIHRSLSISAVKKEVRKIDKMFN